MVAEIVYKDNTVLKRDLKKGNRTAWSYLMQVAENIFKSIRLSDPSIRKEEVVQDTLVSAYTFIDKYDSGRRIEPWIKTIMINKIKDVYKKRSRHQTLSLDTHLGSDNRATFADILEDDSGAEYAGEEFGLVRQMIDGLPANDREILYLAYSNRTTYRGIGLASGIVLGTVKSRLHGAITKMRTDYLNKDGRENGHLKKGRAQETVKKKARKNNRAAKAA